MTKLLLATHNLGKIAEYRALLADLSVQIVSLQEAGITLDVEETGATFEENAILKARSYAALSGLWTWADDSGLEVDALGGAPGIHSARYAGPGATDTDRWRKLLADLAALPGTADEPSLGADRGAWTARFRCVVALVAPDGSVHTTEGTLEGQIVPQPQGTHGFGYDPIFLIPEKGQTLAQLPTDYKNLISHRGQAAARARIVLGELLKG